MPQMSALACWVLKQDFSFLKNYFTWMAFLSEVDCLVSSYILEALATYRRVVQNSKKVFAFGLTLNIAIGLIQLNFKDTLYSFNCLALNTMFC